MERDTFPRPAVEKQLRHFVLAHLLIDHPDPKKRSAEWAARLKTEFKTSAIPLYAAYRPDGRLLGSITFPGGSLDAFAKRMEAFLHEKYEEAERK